MKQARSKLVTADVMQDPFSSINLLREQLTKLGYTANVFTRKGVEHVSFTSKNGRNWTTPAHKIAYPLRDTPQSIEFARDKTLSHELAVSLGIPIPKTYGAVSEINPNELLKKHGRLIVKPSQATLSRGLTLNITTPLGLSKAIKKAGMQLGDVIIQEQVEGEEIRCIVLDGQFAGALLRRTPRVVGDSTRSVSELIGIENEQRSKIKTPYITYPLLDATIIDEKYIHSDKVLSKGELLELSKATMIKNGCSVYNISATIHPSYVDEIERFAQASGIGYGSVDIICKDYTIPATKRNHWFLECNSAPVIKLCYGCRDGDQLDIVPALAAAIDRRLHESDMVTMVGIIEKIHLPALGIYDIEAKIDTGAYSGAVHCRSARVVTLKTGKKVLRILTDYSREPVDIENYSEVYVRSASGHRKKRYRITTDIIVRHTKYTLTIGVTNRKYMQKQVLIGRRFLREHNMLVDVRVNQELDSEYGGKL